MSKRTTPAIVRRILSHLCAAEAQEPNAWLRDDLRIARLILAHASRGDAVYCTPHVLASYEVLGLHPEKVWPAIEARRLALLGPLYEVVQAVAVPKKPPQSVKLWCEKSNGARAANSRAGAVQVLREPPTSVPMAAPSIAELYPKSDASSSGKTRGFSYGELLSIVKFSGAPHSVRHATLNALTARGRWPKDDGIATGVICVSLEGMMLGNEEGSGNVVRSTARWRVRQACKLRYWKQLRRANSWSNCPKCGTERQTGLCEKCGYRGRAKTPEGKANFDEFCRPFMYEIDIEKFRHAPRAKGLQYFATRTYDEYRTLPSHSSPHPHAEVTPIRKPAAPVTPPPHAPAPAAPLPARPAAEHIAEHRVVTTQFSARLIAAAKRVMEMCGMPEIGGGVPYVESAILAEAKFRGVEIEDAAKHIAECGLRDQRNGIALTRFYFRDGKWRSNGGRQTSAGAERSERSKRNILDGFAANSRSPDAPDGPERKE